MKIVDGVPRLLQTHSIDQTHTLNHKNCASCATLLKLRSKERAMYSLGLFEACELLYAQKSLKHLKPRSLEDAKGHLNALMRFFGDVPLNQITAASFIAYQQHRPASRSWLQKQTRKLRKASGVSHLNPHLFRHQFATELLENPDVSEETAVALCGWVNPKMIARYSHTRIEAKFEAVKLLEKKQPQSDFPQSKKIIQFPRK